MMFWPLRLILRRRREFTTTTPKPSSITYYWQRYLFLAFAHSSTNQRVAPFSPPTPPQPLLFTGRSFLTRGALIPIRSYNNYYCPPCSSSSSLLSSNNRHYHRKFGSSSTTDDSSHHHQQQQQQHQQTPEEKRMTTDCKEIYEAAINAVNPTTAIRNQFVHINNDNDNETSLRFRIGSSSSTSSTTTENDDDSESSSTSTSIICDLDDYDELVLVAFGKASSAMATSCLNVISNAATSKTTKLKLPQISGVVIAKDNHVTEEEYDILESFNIKVYEAAHPVPDERNVIASKELLKVVQESSVSSSASTKRTLVIACISGGGSALFCCPQSNLSLQDIQQTNTALLQSGWRIQDMNVLRKRLEQGKGGRLAAAAATAGMAASDGGGGDGSISTASDNQVISLILSDVLGDPLDLIASGPTVPDTSTWQDAWELVQRLPEGALPEPVIKLLQEGKDGLVEDSPTSNHPVFQQNNCFNCLVGNNALAVSAAASRAEELGYTPIILGTQIEGEAREVARVFVGLAQHLRQGVSSTAYPMVSEEQYPVALIAGGETTVSMPPNCKGKGGRNQEFALAAALALRTLNLRQIVLASIGTDGSDGPTDAAGAIVDGGTVGRLPTGSALEALESHNSYPYLIQTDSKGLSPLVRRGPTGTNVADVCVTLIHNREQQNK